MRKKNKWEDIEFIAKYMDSEFQHKMEFANNFLINHKVSDSNNWVWMGLIRKNTLKYFIYAIIYEYEEMRKQLEISEENPPRD